MSVRVPKHVRGSQRIPCGSQFSLPATWVLGIEVRSADLVASAVAELSYQP